MCSCDGTWRALLMWEFMMIKVFLENHNWWCEFVIIHNTSHFCSTKIHILSSFFSLRIMLTFPRAAKGMNGSGPVGFGFFKSVCSHCPQPQQVSVHGFHPDRHPLAHNCHISKCLAFTVRTILVEALLSSSLLTHLLRNLKSLLSKHEKLAAKSLGILGLPMCLAWHGE